MTIIGDVHGCYKTLLALIAQLPKDEPLCFVGDLVDRGPDSKAVVEFVRSNNHHCVLGNHEDMMLEAIKDHFLGETHWYNYNGGDATVSSYKDTEEDQQMLIEHIEWMKQLPAYLHFPDLTLTTDKERSLVVSHSSIAKVWNKETMSQANLSHILWNRDVYNGTLRSSNNIYNVFGHSPFKEPKVTKHFADVDTGCVYNEEKGYGKMTAIQFPSMKIYQQENIEND